MRISSLTLRIAPGLGLITALVAFAQQRPATKPAAVATEAASRPASQQQAMIDQYCIMCHSEAAKTAGVVLEGTHIDRVGENTALWEKVLRKFGTGQMPPPGMPRPDADVA